MATRAGFPHPQPNPRRPALAVGHASSASCASLAAAVSAPPQPPQLDLPWRAFSQALCSRICPRAPPLLPGSRRWATRLAAAGADAREGGEPPAAATYYMRVLSTVARELLKPSASVALQRHSHALIDVLPPEADSCISQLGFVEKPIVTYNSSKFQATANCLR